MILQNEWYVTNSRSLPQLIKIALITIANSIPHSLHQKTIFNQTRLQFLSVQLEKFSHRKCSEMVPVTADWTDIFTQSSSEKESSWHVPKSVAVLQPLLLATLHFWGAVILCSTSRLKPSPLISQSCWLHDLADYVKSRKQLYKSA